MKEINMLWVDQEHPDLWDYTFSVLEREYGVKIEMLTLIEEENVLNSCKGKDAMVVHCGTVRPMAGIKDLLVNIKNKYPNIKIGLETGVIHPDLKDLTDFYIDKPILAEEIQSILTENIK